MTQEDKELLLKDLSARIPYNVIVAHRLNDNICGIAADIDRFGNSYVLHYGALKIGEIKPYLRPMSSMTEEEKQMMDNLWEDNNKLVFADPNKVRRYRFYDISVVDFLNSRHFDYRGLIEKGLALEAPEGMYNIK